MLGNVEINKFETEESWLAARRLNLGASEVAALFGQNPWESYYSLWAKRCGLVPDLHPSSEQMEWGRALEEPIAQRYAKETGFCLQDLGRWTILRNPTIKGLACTLDRIIVTGDENVGALEIKTRGAHADPTDIPLMYEIQLQAQLAVTGWKWGALAILTGGQQFTRRDFNAHRGFQATLLDRVTEFWRRVELRDPPPLDTSEATTQAVKALHPEDDGTSVELPASAEEWIQQWEKAKECRKSADEAVRQAETLLRGAIGSATFGVLPDGRQVSLKTQSRKEYVVPATTFRVLRVVGGEKS